MTRLRVGIVGCGAIGSSLAKILVRDMSGQADLIALYDIDKLKARRLSQSITKNTDLAVKNIGELIKKSQFVIESAHRDCSLDIAKKVLTKGRDIMIMSVGGVVNNFKELSDIAKEHNVKIYIPSGAICGIDGLKAAKYGKIKRVILTTRKNPASFKGVKYIEQKRIDLDTIKEDKVLFSGPARQAVKYFPQNINVAAVLSIAGIGPNKTKVKIVASPSIRRNVHEIQIESDAGMILSRTENVLHPDNPKTSFLAVLSAAATLKQILEPVKIGT
jgi:aspartate dehydrogenase